jgi:hypothetical protein
MRAVTSCGVGAACFATARRCAARRLAAARISADAASWRRRCAVRACRAPASSAARARPASRRLRGAPLAAWQRVRDAQTERDYFWNTETNETAWELPAQAAAEPAACEGLSNEELDTLFVDYILTPAAKFDYPSPSAAFMVRLRFRLRLPSLTRPSHRSWWSHTARRYSSAATTISSS